MTQEKIQKLFSSFTQIEFEGGQTMNPTGVRLDLNIAENLTKLLGPQDYQGVCVKSVLGQGFTFPFTLENKQKSQLED